MILITYQNMKIIHKWYQNLLINAITTTQYIIMNLYTEENTCEQYDRFTDMNSGYAITSKMCY